jgi:glycosyltransferase involved in cell wall biosynthesis
MQTRPLDEVIFVDDASTDNSLEVMESYRTRFKRVVVVQNPRNLGVSNSVNVAWSKCTTNYAKTMPSDDWLDLHYFEKLSQLLEQFPESHIAGCAVKCYDEDYHRNWIAGHLLAVKPGLLTPEQLIELDRRNRFAIYGITMLVRTAKLRELGGEDVRLLHSSDTFLWLSLMFPGGFCYVPEPLAFCRVSRQTFSATMVADRERKKGALRAFMQKLINDGSPELQRAMQASGYLVHTGNAILPLLLTNTAYWKLFTFILLRRYILWNWWRVCDRYLHHPWLRWLQPKVPVLEREYDETAT